MHHLSYLQAIIMGLLQGVAELFPISSLGHSILVPAWIGGSWSSMVTDQSGSGSPFLAFIVALHVATALALIVFYWRDWVEVVGGVGDVVKYRDLRTPRSRLMALLVVATIPVGIAGLVLDHPLRKVFAHPLAAAIFLFLNGLVLFIAERLTQRARAIEGTAAPESVNAHGAAEPAATSRAQARRQAATSPAEAREETSGHGAPADFEHVSFTDSLIVGAAQILALFPGISRSGVTISAGLLRKFSHERATHFAFLLATPVILAAGLLKMPELFGHEGRGIMGQVLVGSVVAFISAYVAARWLTRYFRSRTLYPFVAYCLIAGAISIIRFI